MRLNATFLWILTIAFAFAPIPVHGKTSSAGSNRYIVLLDGINSQSSYEQPLGDDNFSGIRAGLAKAGFSQFVYFSYSAAQYTADAIGATGPSYCSGWAEGSCADLRGGASGALDPLDAFPRYERPDTHLSLDDQATVLEWLVSQILAVTPDAQIDLIGYSLGGIVASRWATVYGETSPTRNHIHSVILVESPVGGIPMAGPVLEGCTTDLELPVCALWDAILKDQFGDVVLRQLQLPVDTNSASDSIVNLLPSAGRLFPVTSIQSTADYLVNSESILLCASLCLAKEPVPVGRGSQYWIGVPQTTHHDSQLGTSGLPAGPLDNYSAKNVILTNHGQPLKNSLTVGWVVDAVNAQATPEASPGQPGWSVVIGGHTAPGQFNEPQGVALDGRGAIYVADSLNHRVQKLNSAGQPIAVWGEFGVGPGQFNQPQAVAVDGDGNIYVADGWNHRVQKLSPSGDPVGQWGAASGSPIHLEFPTALAVDRQGNVFVGDGNGTGILKVSPSGELVGTWRSVAGASPYDQLASPSGLALDTQGNLYVVTYQFRVLKLSPRMQLLAQWGTQGSGPAQLTYALGLAVDRSGTVYVADGANDRIQKFGPGGQIVGRFGSRDTNLGEFRMPSSVAIDSAGDVYVTDVYNHRVQKFTSSGRPLTDWGPTAAALAVDFPESVAIDGQGTILIADAAGILKVDASGDVNARWPGAQRGIKEAYGTAIDGAGNVFVVDRSNEQIIKLGSDGSVLSRWGNRGTQAGEFRDPEGIALGPDSSIYVADRGNHRIQRLSPAGDPVAQWGSEGTAAGQFKYPRAIALDDAGNLYVVDSGNHRVQKLSPDGQPLFVWGKKGTEPGEFSDPQAIALDARGDIYVAEGNSSRSSHRIQELSPDGQPLAQWGTTGIAPGQFQEPSGLAIDASGNIYVADRNNHRIQRLRPAA